MKVVLFFLGVLAFSQSMTLEETELQAEAKRIIETLIANGVTPKALEDNIRQLIENVLNSCEDPCYIESKDVNVDLMGHIVVLKGLLQNLTLRGLSVHKIDPLTFTLLPIKFNMGLYIDTVQVESAYNLEGNIAEIVPLWGSAGDGGLLMNVTGVKVDVTVELSVKNLSLYVKDLGFDFQLDSIFTNLQNFCGDVGEVLGPAINDNLVDYIRRILYFYKDDIKNVIVTAVNEFLDGKSLSDLIDIINGLSSTTVAAPVTLDPPVRIVHTYA